MQCCLGKKRVVLQVTQRYLEYLVSQRRFDEAASVCARLLKVCARRILSFFTHFSSATRVAPELKRPQCHDAESVRLEVVEESCPS